VKDDNIEQGLHHLKEHAERTSVCPDEFVLAALAGGAVALDNIENLEEHLSDCKYCIGQIADLRRISELDVGEPVPDLALARARRLGQTTRFAGQAPRWAAAAVVVLAVGIISNPYSNKQQAPGETPEFNIPATDIRQSRSINTQALRPEILQPMEGKTLSMAEPTFRWTPIPGSLYYDIRLVTVEGEIVWQERVEDTTWTLPAEVELDEGGEYYARVDAYLAEAKRVSSRHMLFKVEQQP
jgi:hypothetical protein